MASSAPPSDTARASPDAGDIQPVAQKASSGKPERWIIERTFGWLMQARRLARDYETKTASSEAMVLVQASRIMLRSLAK